VAKGRVQSSCSGPVLQLQGQELGRAALVAGAIGRDAITGFSGANHRCGPGGWTGNSGHVYSGKQVRLQKRCQGAGRIRAPRRDHMCGRWNVAHLDVQRAVVFPIAAATGRQLRVVRRRRQRGRDQRKAEDQHQRDCECASHQFIVPRPRLARRLRARLTRNRPYWAAV
jgi:hypothetical protein